jgi:steroid 5-alpha reductase family enzyme
LGFVEVWLMSATAILVAMAALWLLSLVLRNASIVDVAWGLGFAGVAVLAAGAGDGYGSRRALVAILACAWGARLAGYIFLRNRGKGEDPRYQAMRRGAGDRFWWFSFFQVFLLQGALMWFISAPLIAAATAHEPHRLGIADAAGVLIWIVGFGFEAIGDWQLARFKKDPANRGQVMDQGLWQYTRHPNYFGDATAWWGFFIIAAGTADGYWTVLSPLLMTFLLVRVSGVALLERSQVRAKPAYRNYVERTSSFIPWFPRRPASEKAGR